MTRRQSLLALAAPAALPAQSAFSFVHMTDLHLQPEMRAAEGCAMAVAKVAQLAPDFVITGGDLIMDAAESTWARAELQYGLLAKTLAPLQMPLYHVLGNHDVFGTSSKSGVPPSAPHYGKQVFEERMGKRYQAFSRQGWHFVLLDSIGDIQGRDFRGYVDPEQLEWLRAELAQRRPNGKLIVVTHVPLASAVLQLVADPWKTPATYLIENSRAVLELLWPHRPRLVLQGHTHIRERVLYNGCEFITSGAVCGNWWKGPREGHPEGFAVITIQGNNINWRYETYGFRADILKAG
jgi:3',5'-cyclic AMP phosphodiesterase CpdA